MNPPAVVLLSGGLDSTTVLAMAKRDGFACHALSFRYGQRHEVELDAASKVASVLGVEQHVVVDIDLRFFGGSALTADVEVPKHESALAWAEVLESSDIFIGVNALDYSGYPDCRPEFIHSFQEMARLATKVGVEETTLLQIHTPLIDLTKAEIIGRGEELGVDYGLTTSCYDPDAGGAACGSCDSCLLRRRGFEEAGVPDPTCYSS